MAKATEETDWQAVTAKALAFMCLAAADLRDKSLGDQAELLDALGLSRADAAKLLNTTEGSLGVLLRRKGRGSRKNNGRKKA